MAAVQFDLKTIPKPLLEHHLDASQKFGKLFREWSTSGNIPQALILAGPKGLGKRSMALYFTQWLFCTGPKSQTLDQTSSDVAPVPCESCLSCRKAKSQGWVDVIEISDEGTGSIKVDQLKKILEGQGFSPHESSYKVILIDEAEKLTPQAANALLKTIEEPPPQWLFLFTVSELTRLLPTIRSRCQAVTLTPLTRLALEEILKASVTDSTKRTLCLNLAQGNLGQALDWSNEETWELRERLAKFLNDPAQELNSLLDWAAQEDTHFEALLSQLELILFDLTRASVQSSRDIVEDWLNFDLKSTLEKFHGKQKSTRYFLTLTENLHLARMRLQTPVNKKILIQNVLTSWCDFG